MPIALTDGIMGPMNKGYAFGFLIVLLVIALGLYVAFTSFVSSREALSVRPTSSSSTQVVQATRPPTSPAPTDTATAVIIPTPVPGLTITLTAMVPTDVSGSPAPTNPPEPTLTNPPPDQPTDTPTPPVQPPTPLPVPAYQFRVAGPPAPDPNYPNCCYIFGTVRDATGNGLEGIQVQIANEWTPPVVAVSKGGTDLGKYDIPIGRDTVTWYVILVDAAGNQISTQVQVPFDPNVSNGYRVDWQRTY